MKNFLSKIASLAENRAASVAPTKKADGSYRGYYLDGGSKGNSNGDWIRNTSNRLVPYAFPAGGILRYIYDSILSKKRGQGL